MTKVLIKLMLYPCRNYCGALMADYKLINRETALIIKDFLNKYHDCSISFYYGDDGNCKLSDVDIIIIDDQNIIDAFILMQNRGIIESSYYIYDIITTKLMNIYLNDDNYEHEPSEEEIIEAHKNHDPKLNRLT